MTLLAESLASQGLRVAHIVWPLRTERRPTDGAGPTLIERPAYAGDRGRAGKLAEARHIWRGMREADAAVYVFRGGGPQLLIGAAFCRLHRRRLVFSSAIDIEFDFNRTDRTRAHLRLFRAAVARADLIVVQSRRQIELAEAAGLGRLTRIPSFAEPVDDPGGRGSASDPEAFVWIGRLVSYKQPLAYLDLAQSVGGARFRMVYLDIPETDEDRRMIEELHGRAGGIAGLELLGQLPREETLAQIERAVAVVSTSVAEGMPNVFLEAWSRGVPVLTLSYDPDGAVAAERLGIVADGSADAFAAGAETLWRDRKLRDELGANGRGYVRRTHSPEVVGRLWAEHLRELAADA